jgi:hypothetical protein
VGVEADSSYVPAGRPLWSLTEEVRIGDPGPDGSLTVCTPWRTVVIDADPMVAECLYRMTLGPVALQNVAGLSGPYQQWKSGHARECAPAWQRLGAAFDQLAGCVVPSLALHTGTALDTDTAVVSAVPLRPVERFRLPAMSGTSSVRLRPGTTVLGTRTARLVGRTARYRADLAGPAVELVRALGAAPTGVDALSRRTGLAPEAVSDVLAYLAGVDLVTIEA